MSVASRSLELLRRVGPITLGAIAARAGANAATKFLLNWRHNVAIHRSATVDTDAKFGTDGTIRIGADCRVREQAKILPAGGYVTVGANSLVNMFTILYGQGGLDIGEDVLIGPHTTIVPANHRFERRDVPVRTQGLEQEGIVIGDDVWIGSNCVVLDGVTVGEGAVVAAGSVVTESVQEYAVVAGAPAEQIDTR